MNGSIAETEDSRWKALYRAGGVCALIACALETAAVILSIVFSGTVAGPASGSVLGWFTLLHDHRVAGLVYLGILDFASVPLTSVMFLALCVALRRGYESWMAIAAALALLGIAVYLATNTVVPMDSLSVQYAAATTDAQRALLLAAGQAVLAVGGVGIGAYMAFLLMGMAGLTISVVMLRTRIFSRTAAHAGILANVVTLAYYAGMLAAPSMSVFLIWGSGLLYLIWMILAGLRLCRLG